MVLDLFQEEHFYFQMVVLLKCNDFWSRYDSSVHIDNKKKYILILGEGPTQGLDSITLTAGKKYSINFTKGNTIFCLSLYHNKKK